MTDDADREGRLAYIRQTYATALEVVARGREVYGDGTVIWLLSEVDRLTHALAARQSPQGKRVHHCGEGGFCADCDDMVAELVRLRRDVAAAEAREQALRAAAKNALVDLSYRREIYDKGPYNRLQAALEQQEASVESPAVP